MTSHAFSVLDVSSWESAGIESIGQDEKEWLVEPGPGIPWLFKPVVAHHDGFVQGEDWAEKLVNELGRRLGVPCARIELASRRGRRGCISRTVCPKRWEMQPGRVQLAEVVAGYQPGAANVRGRPGHSLQTIRQALAGMSAPPHADVPAGFDAFDVFAGYLVLDAWVANRDRHDENWSILRPPPGDDALDALAGSYDHASSLGFNLRDPQRAQRVRNGTVDAWARRGTAWRFEHDPVMGPPTLVELADRALRLVSSAVRAHWLERLSEASKAPPDLVAAVPELSGPAATFVLSLLAVNTRRLVDECH